MIPARFEYIRVTDVSEAVLVLSQHGDEAKLIAGGHSLLPLMKLRLVTPPILIDIGRVEEMRYITDAGDHIAIGAATRHVELERSHLLHTMVPILAHVAKGIGDPQIRHRGTLGGSLAHADPAADLPAALLALEADLVARGPAGDRIVRAGDFFKSYLETVLQPDELLVEIRIPKVGLGSWAFDKFTRRAIDWAIVGVAAVERKGKVNVALMGMGPTPLRATATELALRQGANTAAAAVLADADTRPLDDGNASSEYRRHIARVLTRRALLQMARG